MNYKVNIKIFPGLWQDDDEIPEQKVSQLKKDLEIEDDTNDNFLESTIIKPQVVLPEIPVLNITDSTIKSGITSTEWAEMIDVSQPVPEFKEKIKDLAHAYPFDLDNFQKQVCV